MTPEQRASLEELSRQSSALVESVYANGLECAQNGWAFRKGFMVGAQAAWEMREAEIADLRKFQTTLRTELSRRADEIAELKKKIETMCYDSTVEYQIVEAVKAERERGNMLADWLENFLNRTSEFIECRSDEDCDHCHGLSVIHRYRNPQEGGGGE